MYHYISPEKTNTINDRPTHFKHIWQLVSVTDLFRLFHSNLPLKSPTLFSEFTMTKVTALWVKFKVLQSKQKKACSQPLITMSSRYFHQRSLIIKILCGVAFMISSMFWHCLPTCIFSEDAFLGLLVDHGTCFTSAFTVPHLVST